MPLRIMTPEDRAKLDALAHRVSANFNVLVGMEEEAKRTGEVDPRYRGWSKKWEQLLLTYEMELDRWGVTR